MRSNETPPCSFDGVFLFSSRQKEKKREEIMRKKNNPSSLLLCTLWATYLRAHDFFLDTLRQPRAHVFTLPTPGAGTWVVELQTPNFNNARNVPVKTDAKRRASKFKGE